MRTKFIIGLISATCCASAATLSVNMTVDNSFNAYISTDDSVLGTLIGSGVDWTSTYTFGTLLTPGVTSFIHVVATNSGGPGGFLGDFSLDDPDYKFVNGTQSLLSNIGDWGFSTIGFGGSYITPTDEGSNTVNGTWFFHPAIDGSARWVWDPANCGSCTVYFSTAITADAPGAVPEPATFVLLGAGIALMVARAFRPLRPQPARAGRRN